MHCIVRMCDPDGVDSEERCVCTADCGYIAFTPHYYSLIGYSVVVVIFLIFGCVLLVVLMVLWMAVGFLVGLQESKFCICSYIAKKKKLSLTLNDRADLSPDSTELFEKIMKCGR